MASFDGVRTSWYTILNIKQPKTPEKIAIDQAHMDLRLK